MLSFLTLAVGACSLLQTVDIASDGCVDLRDFARLQNQMSGPSCAVSSAVVDLVLVPSAGLGPSYEYWFGRFAITNEQYVQFLNDAQVDGGVTRRGSSIMFLENGDVRTLLGTPLMRPRGLTNESRILFDPNTLVGQRYRVQDGFESHPATAISWFGAVKFCNWLTIVSEKGETQVCYTEGPADEDWHPIVVSAEEWRNADLDSEQRAALVGLCGGFRLPMDGVGLATGALDVGPNAFGEWIKAASYDVRAPAFERVGLEGERISPRHWAFGFGRDTLSPGDANFIRSNDPYDDGTTPVGYFDGVAWLAGESARTNDTNNRNGMYDASGNVFEWGQDHATSGNFRGLRGGAWSQRPFEMGVGHREYASPGAIGANIGFRVMKVTEDFSFSPNASDGSGR